jgi:hypothetical protein
VKSDPPIRVRVRVRVRVSGRVRLYVSHVKSNPQLNPPHVSNGFEFHDVYIVTTYYFQPIVDL